MADRSAQILGADMNRANYIGAPEFFELNQACVILTEAFGHNVYLVGSSIERRDYRDVDVRCILEDDEYTRLFTDPLFTTHNPLWSLMCCSISLWLSKRTGLKIDFQFQQQTTANDTYPARPRHALGIFLRREQ